MTNGGHVIWAVLTSSAIIGTTIYSTGNASTFRIGLRAMQQGKFDG